MSARTTPMPATSPPPPRRQRLESTKTPLQNGPSNPPPAQRQRLESTTTPRPKGPLASLRKLHARQAQANAKARECPNSSCKDKDVGEEDGQIICRGCGTVISDANIVAELQFAETSGGGHQMIGQHVGSDQAHARGGLTGLKNGSGLESRDFTISEGRRHINQLGAAFHMNEPLKASGLRVFTLASANNFIQGRTIHSVAAVSLYIACRMLDQGSPWMLIDFSDIMQLNVFKLGQIYKDLVEELRLNGPGNIVRPYVPEQLIQRFASRLELGPDQGRVENDAVRILQRMKRDWITPGRRPAGVCGAACIIAARMHNYRRSAREMEHVAKVGAPTLMKRLEEFARTESSGLTIEEFRTITLEHDADPPVVQEQSSGKGRRKRKRQLVDVDDDGDTDPESQREISRPPTATNDQLPTPANTQQEAPSGSQSMPPPPLPGTAARPAKKKRGRPPKGSSSARLASAASSDMPEDPDIRSAMSNPASVDHASALTQVLDADAAGSSQSIESQSAARRPIAMTEDISDSEFGDDPEISNCRLTEEEEKIKTRIWTHENYDWIRLQHSKELRLRLAEESGTLPKVKRRVRRRTRMGDMSAYRRESTGSGGEEAEEGDEDTMPATSTENAVAKMMKKRAYSKKINYEALNKYFRPTSSRSSSSSDSRRENASAVSGAVGAEGTGGPSASPASNVAADDQVPASPNQAQAVPGADDPEQRQNTKPVLPVPDDIQAIAQEEEAERHMLDPIGIVVDHGVIDVNEDDVEDEPGDYISGEDVEDASGDDDDDVGYEDDDYD